MSRTGDYRRRMTRRLRIDDETTEAILSGARSGDARLAPMVAVVDEVRNLGHGPIPTPSAVLVTLFAQTTPRPVAAAVFAAADEASRGRRPRMRRRTQAVVASFAMIGLVGVAGVAGALPDRVQRAVADVVERLTPFSIPRPQPRPDGAKPASPGRADANHPVAGVPDTTGGSDAAGGSGAAVAAGGSDAVGSVDAVPGDAGELTSTAERAGTVLRETRAGVARTGEAAPADSGIEPTVPDERAAPGPLVRGARSTAPGPTHTVGTAPDRTRPSDTAPGANRHPATTMSTKGNPSDTAPGPDPSGVTPAPTKGNPSDTAPGPRPDAPASTLDSPSDAAPGNTKSAKSK